jgi:hypothetical protein
MKASILPDWFAPLFAWIITILVLGAAVTQAEGVYVNRGLLWFPPLLAVAWTAGFVGMLRFKKKFREEYEALGSPQLFGSPYEGRQWKFKGYLFGFRFLQLGDTVVSVSFSIFVVLTLVGLIAFLSFIVRS